MASHAHVHHDLGVTLKVSKYIIIDYHCFSGLIMEPVTDGMQNKLSSAGTMIEKSPFHDPQLSL